MTDHFRESFRLAAEQPGGSVALAALAVSAVAALALLGLLSLQRVSKAATVSTASLAAGAWLGSVSVAVAMVRDGHDASLQLWHRATADVSALSAATARAEAGHVLLALAVVGVCAFCVALALGRSVSVFLRGTATLRVALPGTLALLTGTLVYGLARRIDLTYFEFECGASFRCAAPVISGTVVLTNTIRTVLLIGAVAATIAALLVAKRLRPPTKGGLLAAAGVFALGTVTWGATRSLSGDASAPLPSRRVGQISCAIALARADSASKETCSMCGPNRGGPIIEVRGARLTIDGKAASPEALSAERTKYVNQVPRQPPESAILIDPRSDWPATVRSLAHIRDRYHWLADLALQEAAPVRVKSQTAGSADLPAQCCCIRVELLEGEAPSDWRGALQRAAETGKLEVGPKTAPSL